MKTEKKEQDKAKSRKRKSQDASKNNVKEDTKVIEPKYGPLVTFPYQRIWSRAVLILGMLVLVYFTSKSNKEIFLAKQKDQIQSREHTVRCSNDYRAEIVKYPGCVPEKCSRYVTDKLVTETEALKLLEIGQKGFSLGVSDGGASILDLHSGALSMGKVFVNISKLDAAANLFSVKDFAVYKVVRTKIQHLVSHHFGVSPDSLYLTHPTFFSRLTSKEAATPHDEYWHPHVDKETYKTFHYTCLLYLNNFGVDFEGGRFVFIEENNSTVIVEPRRGRVSTFTSGSENRHFVEKVTSGTRYALTVSFTCDKNEAISDPSINS